MRQSLAADWRGPGSAKTLFWLRISYFLVFVNDKSGARSASIFMAVVVLLFSS